MTSVTLESKFSIDPSHTSVEFTVRHMVFSKVRGRFGSVAGSLVIGEGSNVPLDVHAEIDVATLDTREAQRAGHLKSEDFLHAQAHPSITFDSTAVTGTDTAFQIIGDLTIKGTTRSVTLDASVDGRGKDPWGNDRIAFSAHGTINRGDYGMTFNQVLETGGVLVGEDVQIELTVQAVRAPA